ncbi:MAG: hypothetical protein ACI9B9_002052 [Halioglobus sp.]|jgi:hypothetical protein
MIRVLILRCLPAFLPILATLALVFPESPGETTTNPYRALSLD